jgi:hypothetical protein
MGYAHFGPNVRNVGTDILPEMGAAAGAAGFEPPLASGSYTWWIQQIGSATTYQFDFLVSALTARGDFDADGSLTATDIDLLSAAVRDGGDLSFDVNLDGSLDQEDRRVWVEELAETFFGDAALNGDVAFDDFVSLANGFGSNGGWGQGDFDGSGLVQFPDFVLLAGNFGNVRAAAAAVPEPATLGLVALGLFAVLGQARWRAQSTTRK